jgi:predicted transcriptional regulator
MIEFSCRKISQEDLVRCAFGLNKTEYNLLVFLLKQEQKYTAIQISEKTGLDRTTIQKAIKNLVGKELADRLQVNIEGGGYTFLYRINDKEKIKGRIKSLIRNWSTAAEAAINKL